MRTKRTNGTTTYKYTYHGSQLTHMTRGSDSLHFYYDASGRPFSVVYSGATYFYVTNLQGDVVAILNANGVQVVGYTYDAWGNVLTTTGSMASSLGQRNPLRYRGYVYDTETGLYYLQSRYYNPEWGRFLNADSQLTTKHLAGANLFVYCNNNPVMYSDPYGTAPEWWQWAVSGIAVVAGIALIATGYGGPLGGALLCAGVNSIVGSYISESSGGSSLAGWADGGITGFFSGYGAGVAGKFFVAATETTNLAMLGNLAKAGRLAFAFGAGGKALGELSSLGIDKKQVDLGELAENAAINGVINGISAFGAGVSSAVFEFPSLTPQSSMSLISGLTVGIALIAEAICDLLGVTVTL